MNAWPGLLLAAWMGTVQAAEPFKARAEEAGRNLASAESDAERERWAEILATYARDKDPGVSHAAREALRLHVARSLRTLDDSAVYAALEGLAGSDPAPHEMLLREVLASRHKAWLRAAALRHLAGLTDEVSIPLLKASLSDRGVAFMAAWRLGLKARGSRDPALLRSLTEAGENARDPHLLGAVAWALRSVGGEQVRPVLAEWIDRLEGWSRTDAVWFVRKVDPLKAVGRLVELGVLARAPDENHLGQTWSSREADGPAPVSLALIRSAFSATAGCVFLDVQHGASPDRLDWVRTFADVSKGRFAPEKIRLQDDRVAFDLGGRAYLCAPGGRDVGREVNRALAGAGHRERFVALEPGPPFAVYVLVDPAALKKAAQELDLPIRD